MSQTGSRRRSDTLDKANVTRYLAERCGLAALELPVMADRKAPDFEVFDRGQRILIAELKT